MKAGREEGLGPKFHLLSLQHSRRRKTTGLQKLTRKNGTTLKRKLILLTMKRLSAQINIM